MKSLFVVEAVHQAQREAFPTDPAEPKKLHIRYLRMIELDEECALTFAEPTGSTVGFELRQAGILAAEGSLTRDLPS